MEYSKSMENQQEFMKIDITDSVSSSSEKSGCVQYLISLEIR